MEISKFERIFNRVVPSGTYAAQISISLAVIIFCMVRISQGDETTVYLPVITGTAAYWLPSPKTETDTKAESVSAAAVELVGEIIARREAEAKEKARLRALHVDEIERTVRVAMSRVAPGSSDATSDGSPAAAEERV